MTLTEWQKFVHSLYQGDISYPIEGDNDWNFRLNLLAWTIGSNGWDGEEGILWSELWKQLSDASDGAKTILVATTSYATPTDFRFPGGFVRLTDANGKHAFYKVYTPQKAELFRNTSETAVYFTGNKKDGFKVNFLDTPTAGLTINYPYYKEPFIPTAGANVIEMSDPWYSVQMTLSKLHELDGEGDRAILALNMAKKSMSNMRIKNIMPTWYQENYVPDRDHEVGGRGFGQ